MKYLLVFMVNVGKGIGLEFFLAWILKRFSPDLIFCFHEVQSARLAAQVRFLKRIYEPRSLAALLEHAFVSGNEIPKRPKMAFTLDDCLRRDVQAALPLFANEATPCTFFVPTNYAESGQAMWPNKLRVLCAHSEFMISLPEGEKTFGSLAEKESYFDALITAYLYSEQTTEEIEEEVDKLLAINRVIVPAELEVITAEEILGLRSKYPDISDFQSHTMSHLKLSISNSGLIEKEFVGSKTYLYELTGQSQDFVCYPYGSAWHIGNAYLIAGKHYRYGLTLIRGVLQKGTAPLYIPRVALYHKDDELRIALKILTAIVFTVFKKNRPPKN